MANYKESPLATRPKTLDQGEYYNLSPEFRRAEENRTTLRSQLKRQFLLQLNNPRRKELIFHGCLWEDQKVLGFNPRYLSFEDEWRSYRFDTMDDPALTRWTHARSEIFPNFRPTTKTSLLAGVFGVLPLFVLYVVFKTDRDRREAKIKAGTYKRPFTLYS